MRVGSTDPFRRSPSLISRGLVIIHQAALRKGLSPRLMSKFRS